jgi:hypothetical protein
VIKIANVKVKVKVRVRVNSSARRDHSSNAARNRPPRRRVQPVKAPRNRRERRPATKREKTPVAAAVGAIAAIATSGVRNGKKALTPRHRCQKRPPMKLRAQRP